MSRGSLKFWVAYILTSVLFFAVTIFSLTWAFGLALQWAIPVSMLIFLILLFISTRKTEAPPLVMRESKWLDVEGEKE